MYLHLFIILGKQLHDDLPWCDRWEEVMINKAQYTTQIQLAYWQLQCWFCFCAILYMLYHMIWWHRCDDWQKYHKWEEVINQNDWWTSVLWPIFFWCNVDVIWILVSLQFQTALYPSYKPSEMYQSSFAHLLLS